MAYPAAFPFVAADVLAALLAFGVAVIGWKRRNSPGGLAFTIALACSGWWSLWHGISLAATTLDAKILLANIWFAGAEVVPYSLFIFAIQYTRSDRRWPNWWPAPIAAVPVLTYVASAFTPLYFWGRTYLDTTGPFPLFGVEHGPLYFLWLVLSSAAIAVVFVLLLRMALMNRGLYRRQAVFLVAGLLVPIVSSALYITGHSPIRNLDFSAISLTAGNLFIAAAVFSNRLLDIVPVAHQLVMEAIGDAVIVTDLQERVVYLNDAAHELAPSPAQLVLGRPLVEVFPDLYPLVVAASGASPSQQTWSLGLPPRFFDVAASPLLDRSGQPLGRAVVLRDVTHHRMVDSLQRSRQQIIAAEEHVRREIAEMLHGRVQSKLLSAWFQLGDYQERWSKSEAETEELTKIREAIERISEQDVRRASHLLHPSIIRFGLVPAVRDLADGFSRFFKVEVIAEPALSERDSIGAGGINETLRLVAYRVVEEALNNAAKHAHAEHVEICLGLRGEQLEVAVKDDGVGFEPSLTQPGLGLDSVIGRIDHHGGTWRVDSAPGAGTTIHATLPLTGVEGEDIG